MTTFGAELRRVRTAAGLSLTDLAKQTHYTKGYLSKVETGRQQPSPYLVRQCDALLVADGSLVALARPVPMLSTPAEAELRPDTDDVWFVGLGPDGGSMFQAMGRREMLTLSAASMVGLHGSRRRSSAPVRAEQAIPQFRELFDRTRELGQATSPALVLPMVIAQAHALRALVPDARPGEQVQLGLLAARNAEYAGWMAQESGDDKAALWWTSKSVDIAAEVGDHDLAAYSLVRQALVTMYQRDAASTIALAQHAQADRRTPPRILGLAAQREGQGHALAGDYDDCMRALDRARSWLHLATTQQDSSPVLGTSHVSDPVEVVTGWCLYDLGRPADAAEVLDREVARIPRHALRSWCRFTARQALAHATAGHVDRACELTRRLLGAVGQIDSETVISDVRRIASTLRRWHNHAAARELDPLLNEALHRTIR
jgi:transcriptional regulator with XRE-family HTH domain